MMVTANPRMIQDLRRIAGIIDDRRLEIGLLSVIFRATRERSDALHLFIIGKEHGLHADYVGKSWAVAVKTLASLHRFDEAREFLADMKGASTFWHAIAGISVVEFSGQKADKVVAKELVSNIRASHAHIEAKANLDLALENHHGNKRVSLGTDLSELHAVLRQIEAFEDSHEVKPTKNSAYLRLLAQEIVDRIFARAME